MSILPAPYFPPILGETAGQRIARIVRAYAGCSLHHRRDELGALVGRGVDAPDDVVCITTNCATFAIGVLKAAGCQHTLLSKPYVVGMAFAWLVRIGNDHDAWRPAELPPSEGAVLWYRLPDLNDDHAEFFLSAPDEHGGGGRPDNAITVGHGDIHASWGRPLHRWLDPDALCLPDAHVDDAHDTDPSPPAAA